MNTIVKLAKPRVTYAGDCKIIRPWKVYSVAIMGLMIYRRVNMIMAFYAS